MASFDFVVLVADGLTGIGIKEMGVVDVDDTWSSSPARALVRGSKRAATMVVPSSTTGRRHRRRRGPVRPRTRPVWHRSEVSDDFVAQCFGVADGGGDRLAFVRGDAASSKSLGRMPSTTVRSK